MACQRLLCDVWQIDWDHRNPGVPPVPYLDYWENLVQDVNDAELYLTHSEVVVSLVAILHNGCNEQMFRLRDQMQSCYPNTIAQTTITPEQAVKALEFAIRLWLHICPRFQSHNLPTTSLRQIIEQHIPPRAPDARRIKGRLSDDFCAKHLWRRGGIRIVWTDDINEHLTLVQQDRLVRVFRHLNMLRVLVQDPKSDPFPPDFAHETLDTLYLLFRPFNRRKRRHNIRRMEKHLDADLELAIVRTTTDIIREVSFDLNHYRYWHDRLRAIQVAYDKKKPASLRQWWFDRRDRVQWATFWVAFLVFVLTVVFGVIQSVTGVLQAWAAYHPIAG